MLLDKLKIYTASDAVPMHMPGHKRNMTAFPWLGELGGRLDITEIDGFDNLNDPQEIFAELEERVAKLWGADRSICLVNGSTAGVLSAVRAALERGGELLMARGSHKSVYHAAELTGVTAHYLTPHIDIESGIWGSVTAEDVARALDGHPDVRLTAITSPTYEGVISDVRAIADVCHERGVVLFVDEAHGAHLGFGGFPENSVRCGADLVVQSLHKTLPSLNQTAVLHINGDRVDPLDVRRNTSMFQTSSPSYILASSVDGCVRYLEREGGSAADRWLAARRKFDEDVRGLCNLRVYRGGDTVYKLDPSKIVISSAGCGISGAELMEVFRNKFNIELEMAGVDYVVAMTGMGDTEETLRRLAQAVCDADRMCRRCGDIPSPHGFALPERRMTAHEAIAASGEFCRVADALGRVSAEYVWAYPPGVPLLVPGEVIDEDVIQKITSGRILHSTRGDVPGRILCIC